MSNTRRERLQLNSNRPGGRACPFARPRETRVRIGAHQDRSGTMGIGAWLGSRTPELVSGLVQVPSLTYKWV